MADVYKQTEAWEAKPWKKFEVVVFRLQKRIYRASTCSNRRTVHKLQRLLLTSSAARHLAVRRVTQENRGRRTAGIDGVSSTTPRQRLELVEALRPVIKGWSRYYRHVVSKDVFDRLDMRLHHQLYRWAKRRHPQKHYRWLRRRYWRRVEGRVSFGKDTILPQCSGTRIERHVKVAGRRSPYDGDWTYWGVRLRRYAGLSSLRSKLLSRQEGRCAACILRFRTSDRIEMHHRDGNRSNNSPANLALLHLHCHDQVHGTPDKSCQP